MPSSFKSDVYKGGLLVLAKVCRRRFEYITVPRQPSMEILSTILFLIELLVPPHLVNMNPIPLPVHSLWAQLNIFSSTYR